MTDLREEIPEMADIQVAKTHKCFKKIKELSHKNVLPMAKTMAHKIYK
jgi:hypothetical protein